MHSIPVGHCWPPLSAPHTHHHLLPQPSEHITWSRWLSCSQHPGEGQARGATSRQTASASVLGTMESREPRGEPPMHAAHPAETPSSQGREQGEREPINRGNCRYWQQPHPSGRAGQGRAHLDASSGSPNTGEGAGWREALIPGGQAALRGAGEGAGPGRLALRGRVAHRVLVSTKSLQRRRTGVLFLFSYLSLKGNWLFLCESGRLICHF